MNLRYLIFLILILSFHSCDVRNKPENIDEAIIELDNILTNEQKLVFKNQEEDSAVFEFYKDLGRKIHYSWFIADNLQKNPLLDQLFDLGLQDSETAMKIILKSYHRKLNGNQVDYVKQIEEYKKFSEIEMRKIRDESYYNEFQVSDEIEIIMHIDYTKRNVIIDSFVHAGEFDPKKDLKLKGIITKKFADSTKIEKFFKVRINNINLNNIKYSNKSIKIGKEYIFKISNLRINKHYR